MKELVGILWDFDGTLVSSLRKNFAITKEILSCIRQSYRIERSFPEALKNVEAYRIAANRAKNWRDLYMNEFGLSHNETNDAGKLWAEYQSKNQTPVELFPGLKDFILTFSNVPQGVCSQNSTNFIKNKLNEYGIRDCFHGIVGYDDISYESQKPDPYGFIFCLESFPKKINTGTIIYIGDHEQDMVFAKNAQYALNGKGPQEIDVISIAANYENNANLSHWSVKPDHVANEIADLYGIVSKYQDKTVIMNTNILK